MTRARNLANLANVDTFTVDSSDRVGLGTNNPSTKLQIVGSTNSADSAGGTLGIRQKGDTFNDGITLTSSHANSARFWKDSDGKLHIYNTGTGSNQFVLDNAGEVGIGTDTPTDKLSIGSTIGYLNSTGIGVYKPHSIGLKNGVLVYTDVGYNAGGSYQTSAFKAVGVSGHALGISTDAGSNGLAGTQNAFINFDGSAYFAGKLLSGVETFSPGTRAVFAGNSSVASGNGVIFINRGTNNALNGGDGIGNIEFGNNAGNSFARISAEAGGTSGASGSGDYPGQLKFWTTADGGSAPTQRAIITKDGNFGINAPSPNGRVNIFTDTNEHALRIDQNHASALIQFLETESTSYTGDGIKMHYFRSNTTANNFIACDSNHSGTADREFTLRGDGNAYADGTWNNNGADYAEFFESTTGNAIPVGTTVVLENNKVRAATSSDSVSSIIGVIRPKEPGQASMTIGNTAWNKWSGKYLTDDFDRFILDEHVVYEWTETVEDGDDIFHSYESHQIPEGVTIPSDVVGLTTDPKGNRFVHYRLNPDFDPSLTYVPREERNEWVIVGLVGQVKILDGQPMNDRWIKMRDVSDTVEEWFIR